VIAFNRAMHGSDADIEVLCGDGAIVGEALGAVLARAQPDRATPSSRAEQPEPVSTFGCDRRHHV
jgi:hypothetical protein